MKILAQLAGLVWVLLAIPASAQMTKYTAFRCVFPHGQMMSVSLNGPIATADRFTDPIVFAGIDWRANTAQMVGNAGASKVQIVRGNAVVNFVDLLENGGIVVFSIHTFDVFDGNFIATASRTLNVSGAPLASAYMGTCAGLN